jgi:hypothetical protein
MTYKGVVKGNTVLLEEGTHLPNGATVWVTLAPAQRGKEEAVTEEELRERQAVVARMEEFSRADVRAAHATAASTLKLCVVEPPFDFAALRLRSGRTGWDIAFMHRFGVDALLLHLDRL